MMIEEIEDTQQRYKFDVKSFFLLRRGVVVR